MKPSNLKHLFDDMGLSLLVVVTGGLSIAVFFFTSMLPSIEEHERWNWPGMVCSNEAFRSDLISNLESQPIETQAAFLYGRPGTHFIFAGHLTPIQRAERPENDQFLEADYFLNNFGGEDVTLSRDKGRYYADGQSRYGGDKYSVSKDMINAVQFFRLELHPDLENREIPDAARVYFDFKAVVATVEWDGEVQATYNCFNSDI